jgi:hypothetical protein
MSDHWEALRRRHAALEERLRAEMARPRPDDAEVARIKAEKLRLKDRIARHIGDDAVARGRSQEIDVPPDSGRAPSGPLGP